MNYEALASFEIPDARQNFGPRDAILYALSIGLGQDPLNPWDLDFVDECKGPRIVPSFSLVLGHPGFWLADPRTTVDASRLVHAEEGFRVCGPMPASGEVVGKTRICDIVDKGVDKGALLYLEKELRDAETDALIATMTRTLMLRGDGGYRGPSGIARSAAPMPEGPPDFVHVVPTRPEQALYYRLNGDPNPLHIDPAIAARAGFAKPILHGLCTFGVACQAIMRAVAVGGEPLTGMTARFSAPVFPGETIQVALWRSGFFRARVIERDTVALNNGRAIFGHNE
jgi:acyl dehydratase